VSSMGSVADRNEMPSDFRSERKAKWSYLSRAKRCAAAHRTGRLRLLLLTPATAGCRGPPRVVSRSTHDVRAGEEVDGSWLARRLGQRHSWTP
jgi:hypothetical protein